MMRRAYEPPRITSLHEREVASSLGPVTLSAADITVLQSSAAAESAVHGSVSGGGHGYSGTSAQIPKAPSRKGNR